MKRSILGMFVALALLVPVSTAFAAESTATPGPEVAPARIEAQLWLEDGGLTSLIVVGVIPSGTPLPATVVLPLPKGAVLQWSGEIFSNSSQDLSRDPFIAPDGLSVRIPASESRTVQYEAQYARSTDLAGRRSAKLTWLQSVPAGEEDFAVMLPVTSDDVKLKPAAAREPYVNSTGDKLYQVPTQKLKTGETFEVSVDYAARVPGSVAAARSSSAWDYVLPVALGLLAVVVIALIVIYMRSRPAAPASSEDED